MSDDTIQSLEFSKPDVAMGTGRPWPRYFARMLDVLIFSMVFTVILVLALVIVDEALADRFVAMTEGMGGLFVSTILSHMMAFLPIVLLLATGQTPGKWLFGIRVRSRDGRRMRLVTSLKRELQVWVRGVALGIPLVSLYTLVMNHGDLKNEGITPWDKSLDLVVEHAPVTPWWWIRAILGATIIVAMMLWGIVDHVMSLGDS